MPYLLHTNRLRLRPCRMDDLDALHELLTDAKVRFFLCDDRIISREEVQSFIETSVTNFVQHGYGLWLCFEPQSDLIVGFAGLLQSPQKPPSLIFAIRPQFWRRGYATESARAVLRHAFESLGLERVVADVDEPNEASIRVLEKLGMLQTHRAFVNGRPLLYYEISAHMRTNHFN